MTHAILGFYRNMVTAFQHLRLFSQVKEDTQLEGCCDQNLNHNGHYVGGLHQAVWWLLSH